MNAEARRQAEHYKAVRIRMGVIQPKPCIRTRARQVYDWPIGPDRPAFSVVVAFKPFNTLQSETIFAEVCAKYGFSRAAIRGPSRAHPVLRARQELMYRLYEECRHLSIPQVGSIVNRDHSSCLNGMKVHADRNGLRLTRSNFQGKVRAA